MINYNWDMNININLAKQHQHQSSMAKRIPMLVKHQAMERANNGVLCEIQNRH
jgi:hypothetical protein